MVKGQNVVIPYFQILEQIRGTNPFLAETVEAVRGKVKHHQRFGLAEGRALLDAFIDTDTVSVITKSEDVNDHPELLWTLADHLKGLPDRERSSIGLRALAEFYRGMYFLGYIGSSFDNYRVAITEHIHTRGKLKEFLLSDEFKSGEDTFTIKYSISLVSLLVTIDYKGNYLKEVTLMQFHTARKKWNWTADQVRFVLDVARWIDDHGEPIDTFKDMTAQRLSDTVSYIKKTYTGNLLQGALRFVFDIYKVAIMDHPDYPFFEDSFFWTKEMILDFSFPMQMARGYEIVHSGVTTYYPAYKKVLFCFQGLNRRFANSHRFSAIACDLSKIKCDHYRSIIINYAIHTFCKRLNNKRTFMTWLEQHKKKEGTLETSMKKVSVEEAFAFRAYIFNKFYTPETRNSNLGTVKGILQWADDRGFLEVEPDAYEAFKSCTTRALTKKSVARSLTSTEIIAIEDNLERLAKKDVKALMALCLFRIQLFVDTRAGELCNFDLSNLSLREDGSSVYYAVEKNSGREMIEIRYTPTATRVIMEAIESTRELRASCPLECANNLFLYDAGEIRGHEYKVMSTDAYNTQLRKACELAGLKIQATSTNVRDTFMTSMRRFCHQHKLTDIQQMMLTRHSRKTSINAYLDINISDFLVRGNKLRFTNIKKD